MGCCIFFIISHLFDYFDSRGTNGQAAGWTVYFTLAPEEMGRQAGTVGPFVMPEPRSYAYAEPPTAVAGPVEVIDNATLPNPRYGERRISQALYDKLRRKTPSTQVRDAVNENISLPMPDEALPGLTVTSTLHADHIVSMHNISCMDGFDKLSESQQLSVLNSLPNFVGLSEAANTSKGKKSFAEWTVHRRTNTAVSPDFRQRMMLREIESAKELQKIIDNILKS